MNAVRATAGLLGLGVCLLILIPFQLVLNPIGGPKATVGPRLFFAAVRRLMGVRIQVEGAPIDGMPALYVSNHISWLDIFVQGSLIPGSFVARGDLETWPLFGWASTLQRTVFINRESRTGSGNQLGQLGERLDAGDNLILYPEGTSSDGLRVLPFKSSLFAVAERWEGDEPLQIQPVSIAYTRVNNLPMVRHYRPYVSWIGDMELPDHVWGLLRLGRITATVTFHEPIASDRLSSRKVMCAACRDQIIDALEHHNAGYGSREAA